MVLYATMSSVASLEGSTVLPQTLYESFSSLGVHSDKAN